MRAHFASVPEEFWPGRGKSLATCLSTGARSFPGSLQVRFHIDGNFHQLPAGLMTMEIGGTTPGVQYDQLLVSGT